MVFRQTGGPSVIEAEEFEIPSPGPGEVLIRMAVSGVNPTDWKSRTGDGSGAPPPGGWQIPDHDGAGIIVAVGNGVDPVLLHERVWTFEAAYLRPWGTAAEYTVVPARQVVLLGPDATYELGASLGVPFLTAHRCLTLGESMPNRLGPGALTGRTVLVQGGAGAVGNAAVQLGNWAGATVIATVSSPEKAQLAAAAGATHVIDYKQQDVVTEVRKIVPHGVDVVAEVAAAANAATDAELLAMHGSVAIYAGVAQDQVTVPLRAQMALNSQWHFVLLYSLPAAAKAVAVEDVAGAVVDGAISVGDDVGLPTHRFPLARTADAHAAVEAGAVGKVLVTIDDDPAAQVTDRDMALIHDATLKPGKLELLNAWVPGRSWATGTAEPAGLKRIATYRFDDPAGEVGIEMFLLQAGDAVLHVPLTYRGAPLSGADEHLISTMEHSVLGTRWVYDGCADPVWAEATVAAILTGGTQVALVTEVDGKLEEYPSTATVAGSGSQGTPVTSVSRVSTEDGDTVTIVRAGPYELRVARVVGTDVGGEQSLGGQWDGGAAILVGLRTTA